MRAPIVFEKHTDGTPTAVQHTHALLHQHVEKLARDHEAELSPLGLLFVRRCAYVLWFDARAPIVTTPLAEVLG